MIEFDGYLTGKAEKHFFKKSRKLGQGLLLVAFLVVAPMLYMLSMNFSNKLFFVELYVFGCLGCMGLTFIPQPKKERKSLTPKKIVVEDDYIICIADKYTEAKAIADVKSVVDYGEYYDLSFYFGNVSDKFICQKSLLSKGTLQEFEALFEVDIIRKYKSPEDSEA